MDITFLGTGAAWAVPELICNCFICCEMRRKGESRERTALLLSNKTNLLIDCGPDIRSQLSRHCVDRIDGVLISHEHGDHFIGLDELFAYKRNSPRATIPPIPVYLTAIADEFGGSIPVGAYCQIGGEEIGKEIIRSIGKSPAILMKNHGVFTIGPTPEAAIKTAVMVEDIAKTVFLALLRGTPVEIPKSEVERAHKIYMGTYGQ